MTLDALPPTALVAELTAPDTNARARALAEIVRRGQAATPALLAALTTADSELRARLTQGLAEIVDPAAADRLAELSRDPDERVRAHAASGLAWLHDRRAVEALSRTIDDDPDPLREPFTPSVDALIALGLPALPAVAPLLEAPAAVTRRHAFLVLRMVAESLIGSSRWEALWNELGRYDPAGREPERTVAAGLWRGWIKARTAAP